MAAITIYTISAYMLATKMHGITLILLGQILNFYSFSAMKTLSGGYQNVQLFITNTCITS